MEQHSRGVAKELEWSGKMTFIGGGGNKLSNYVPISKSSSRYFMMEFEVQPQNATIAIFISCSNLHK